MKSKLKIARIRIPNPTGGGYIDLVVGIQWGDEGKGKIVDILAPNYDIVARFNGGPNAGHTIIFNYKKFVLHVMPSGIHHPGVKNVVGSGCVIDPILLKIEIEQLEKEGINVKGNLFISNKAHLITPTHPMLDKASEESMGAQKIGSTLKGIGPTYEDKTGRRGIRVGDIFTDSFLEKYENLKKYNSNKLVNIYGASLDGLAEREKEFFAAVEFLKDYQICDTVKLVNDELKAGKKVLAEGAQGTLLDPDHGTYKDVTSSNVLAGAVCSGLGISPLYIRKIYGAAKAYTTRVGSGPFPTEQSNSTGELLCKNGFEYGSTTGRPRRCGWLDLPLLKYTCTINGVTDLIILKSDVLDDFKTIQVCTGYKDGDNIVDWPPMYLEEVIPIYTEFVGWKKPIRECRKMEELPDELTEYLEEVSDFCEVPISIVSVGPDREETIFV